MKLLYAILLQSTLDGLGRVGQISLWIGLGQDPGGFIWYRKAVFETLPNGLIIGEKHVSVMRVTKMSTNHH